MSEKRCSKCKRILKHPDSIARGLGEICARRLGLLETSTARVIEAYVNPLQTALFGSQDFSDSELIVLPDSFGIGAEIDLSLMATTEPFLTASQVSQ